MAKTFAADLKRFRDLTVEKMERIVRDSVQDVLAGAQTTARGVSVGGALVPGRIPVASGDLVNSLQSSVAGGGESIGAASYVVAVNGYALGAPMSFAWTMDYAIHVEMGTASFPGWHFVGMNAAQWSEHVERNARLVK